MKAPNSIILLTSIVILSLLTVYASANSDEQKIKEGIETMGITVHNVTIDKDGVTVSYECCPDGQDAAAITQDWFRMGAIVIAYAEPKQQMIRIRPMIIGVPIYEAQIDNRDLVLFLNGNISYSTLFLSVKYVDVEYVSPTNIAPPGGTITVPEKSSDICQMLPDMALTSNNLRVIFNENATVSATIHNIGTADASNIVVQFFDGNPDADGTQIGTDQIIRRIAHEGTGTVQVTWTAIPGTHDIFVLVDPYNTIQEANENNNQAYKQITVGGKKTIYVDDDFTDDPANHKWNTIQEGINDANAEDTVLVYNGRYTETVVLNKRLTLIGEGMPEIDAQSLGDAINIKADNCTVKGFNCVNAQPSPYAGIRVDSSNNVIADNTCNDNYKGIYLLGSSNEIRNNIASSNNKCGIVVQASDGNLISNNTVKNNEDDGINLQYSNDNKIADNDVSNNEYAGILVVSSNNNEVRNNVANSNHHQGIGLCSSTDNIISNNTVKENGHNGIYLIWSNDNEVRNNVADSNHYDGINLWKSTDNIISNNTVKNNEDDGISLGDSNNNRIYMNNFVDNQNNVHSGDSTNIWHSTSERTYRFKGNTYTNYLGNYWDDYTGSDTDNDGIGDISYNIISDNNDNYPLKEPVENYFLPIRLGVGQIFFP